MHKRTIRVGTLIAALACGAILGTGFTNAHGEESTAPRLIGRIPRSRADTAHGGAWCVAREPRRRMLNARTLEGLAAPKPAEAAGASTPKRPPLKSMTALYKALEETIRTHGLGEGKIPWVQVREFSLDTRKTRLVMHASDAGHLHRIRKALSEHPTVRDFFGARGFELAQLHTRGDGRVSGVFIAAPSRKARVSAGAGKSLSEQIHAALGEVGFTFTSISSLRVDRRSDGSGTTESRHVIGKAKEAGGLARLVEALETRGLMLLSLRVGEDPRATVGLSIGRRVANGLSQTSSAMWSAARIGTPILNRA